MNGVLRASFFLALLAACPDDDSDATDYVHTCPEVYGSPVARGVNMTATHYADGPSSMVPGSTQLVTVGRAHGHPSYEVDFADAFEAELVGARGFELVRVSRNQFLLKATGEEGSACVKLFDPDAPDDVTMFGVYAAHPLRMAFRPYPDFAPSEGFVYARGARATLEMRTGGGHDIVDTGLRFVHGRDVRTAEWDSVRLYQLGQVAIDVVTSDGVTTPFELEVVAGPDEISILGEEIPSALVAGFERTICVGGRHRGRFVAGLEWTFAVTNANWRTAADSGFSGVYSGCVTVRPTTAGQQVEITARANGGVVEHVLVFDVVGAG